ncbi:YkgB family protein [Nonlabens antarcticus]|uniref:YkgB family protein n=1 Tax=Nonlabens antarcticus TaxID=392714 RepID=UPI0018916D94|nr:DUF417 family protein [Nonlabens antarcticus]
MEKITGKRLTEIGAFIIRYGLVMVLLYVGALKFTTYEAEGIKPLIENSFLMSWGYDIMSVQGFSILIGAIEIVLGLLIALREFSPKLSAFGSLGAALMFVCTLSFLITTPAAWQAGYGFPFASPMPGQFILKDILSIGAALWTAGEALIACRKINP